MAFLGHNLFRSSFLHLSSNGICVHWVEITVLSDLKHSLTYELIQDYLVFIILTVKGLKLYSVTSSIVAEHPACGPSLPIMTCLEKLKPSPRAVSISIPRIISYILLVDLSTWHFHVTILVALNLVRKSLHYPSLRS